jgi:hypothetical protein
LKSSSLRRFQFFGCLDELLVIFHPIYGFSVWWFEMENDYPPVIDLIIRSKNESHQTLASLTIVLKNSQA